MLKKSFVLLIVLSTIINVHCDGENVATRKRKSSRISSTRTSVSLETTESSQNIDESSNKNESLAVVDETPITKSETTLKKSYRVRNCGERIGDDVPFIALLVHTNPYDSQSKKRTLSKGVLISENFVLTTVSSVYHSETFWTVSSVRLGDFPTWNKYANRDKSFSIEIEVDEIFFHKKHDIALIKLKESVNFTDIIRPACLPSSDNYNYKEFKLHMCKRSSSPKLPSDVSMESAQPLSSFDCKNFFSRKQISLSQNQFCVWDTTGDDCAGDISSALFAVHNGRLFIAGLRSYAETNNDDIADPSEYPGVYIKIGKFLNWINAVMKSTQIDEKKLASTV